MDSRSSKWIIPAAFSIFFLLLTRAFALAPFWLPWIGLLTGTLAGFLAISAIENLYDFRRNQSIWFLERQQNAMARTPTASELEAARGVSPEVAKIIFNERRRVWMLKSGVSVDGTNPHSVLYGAPDVTEFFIQYFLESSTEKAVMPKRLLSEGRKNRFDPWGVVDEYTMYDRLIELLRKQGKVHRWSEFDMWEWVEPWTPELVAADYGVELKKVEEVLEEVQ